MGLAAFTLQRLIGMVLVILSVTVVTFMLVHMAPGDPIRVALGLHATPAAVTQLAHQYGLDQPLPVQCLRYMNGLLHGYLGPSFEEQGLSVNDILGAGLPITLWLGLWATIIALVLGVPLGILAAVRHNALVGDNLNMGINMILNAVPPLLLIGAGRVIFSINLRWLPVDGWQGYTNVRYLIMPVLVYASGLMGFYARSMRSFMLEALSQHYVRTARAKGLASWKIIFKHAAKNTLAPFASVLGPTIAFLVVGAFIVETLFDIPGIAKITVDSTIASDYDVTLATTILLALAVVLVNALTDISYAIVDPRVRL
jgi:ABC-type dipeptide/oligopeptide/nickel transport system permease component